jgi:hypothetical protein
MAKNDFLDDEPFPQPGKRQRRDPMVEPEGFSDGMVPDGLPYEQGPADFGGFGAGGNAAPELGPPEGLPYQPGPMQGGEFGTSPTKFFDGSQGAVAAPEGTQYRTGDDKLWLDWIDKTFGTSPTRGGGFANPGTRGNDMAGIIDQFNQETGANAVYEGGPSGDRVNFGEGTRDVRTSGGDLWYDYGSAGGGAPSSGGGATFNNPGTNALAAPNSAGSGAAGTGAPSINLQAGQPVSEIDKARRAQLLKMMGQLGEPYDPSTDPNVQAQTTAYANSRNRGAERTRAKMAERAAASGLNMGGEGSGSFDTTVQGIYDDAGSDIAEQEAGVVGQELTARRQQLMQTLAMANAVGAQDEAQQIQMELAKLDDEYRKSALGQQNNQFGQQMGFNYAQLGQQGNQFQQNLQQQQGQWNDQYGLNMQQLLYGMDRDAMLQALLGGG